MWFDTCAVASAPSLTFVVSVTSGPSVTVALAVSWNKTSQLKLYTKRPTICLWKKEGGGGGNIFSQTSGDTFFLTYMGVRFFPADAIKDFFFLQCRNSSWPGISLQEFIFPLEISLQDFFSLKSPIPSAPIPLKGQTVGLFDWNKTGNGYQAPANEKWQQNLTYTLARSVTLLLIGINYKPCLIFLVFGSSQ